MKNVFLTIALSMNNKIKNIQVIDLNEKKLYCGVNRIGDMYDRDTHKREDIVFYYPYYFEILNDHDLNRFLDINFREYEGKPVSHFFKDYDLSEYLL